MRVYTNETINYGLMLFYFQKDEGSDASLSDSHISPPAKRTSKHADPVCKDKSKSRSTGQREEWSISTGQSR